MVKLNGFADILQHFYSRFTILADINIAAELRVKLPDLEYNFDINSDKIRTQIQILIFCFYEMDV